MTVFNNYFKVVMKYFKIIAINSAIFMAIAIAVSTSGSIDTKDFESTKVKVAVINYDDNSKFIKGFEDYIGEKADLVKIDNDERALKDALFFRKVDYIMVVPKNFTENFIAGKDVKIDTMQVPDSYTAQYSKVLMNDYLNTAKIYLKAGIEQSVLTKSVKEDLSKQATVTINSKNTGTQMHSATTFYNFCNYILLAVIITTVATVMVAFNEDKIKRRNLVSAVSYKSINRQLLLGNIIVSYIIWAFYVIASLFIYQDAMFTTNGLLLIINSGIFVTFILSFSFFIASLTNNREAINGISNVVGLGSSFISGAFVPQEYLGGFVLTIAKFTPSYWFIKANNQIAELTKFDFKSLQPILINILIMFSFTVLIYILIQVTSKLRLKK